MTFTLVKRNKNRHPLYLTNSSLPFLTMDFSRKSHGNFTEESKAPFTSLFRYLHKSLKAVYNCGSGNTLNFFNFTKIT